jgi:hypothetical protein
VIDSLILKSNDFFFIHSKRKIYDNSVVGPFPYCLREGVGEGLRN